MGFFSKLFGKNEEINGNHIYAPMAGQAVAITEVPDPTFAEGMMGNGIAILPTDGKVCAPCDATVDMMFTTGHAVSLSTESGAEILIHVGLSVTARDSRFFTACVQSGQKVRRGELLIEVDLPAATGAGLDLTTPMLVTNASEYAQIQVHTGTDVTNLDVAVQLAK